MIDDFKGSINAKVLELDIKKSDTIYLLSCNILFFLRFFMRFGHDILGGLVAGIVAIPLALALGIASGLGAAAGLYGAIVLGFFASIFGGTKTQISGPTGPMSVVAASVVLVFKDDLNTIMAVFALAGTLQILFGLLKIGKFIKFIPYPVISGFMSGIGIIIIILQLNPMIGAEASSGVLQSLLAFWHNMWGVDPATLLITVLTLTLLYLVPKKIAHIVPSPLLALIVFTPIVYFLHIDIALIGDIPKELPSLTLPSVDLAKLPIIVGYASMLALLGSIDSLLTSLVADSLTKTKHNSNRELIGQGLGNMIASFFGGLVGSGATMRTVVNIKSGGHSRLSGVVHALFLLLVLVFIGSLVAYVPIAVLSGILIKVGIDILDYRLLKRIKYAPMHDLLVMAIVFLLTVFVDLIFAVGVGIVLASLLLVYRISKEANVDIGEQDYDDEQYSRVEKDIRILNVRGAFFFGSTAKILDFTRNIVETRGLIIDITKVPFIDLSAIFALEEMILTNYEKTPIALILNDKQTRLKELKDIKDVLGNMIFENQKEAMSFLRNHDVV